MWPGWRLMIFINHGERFVLSFGLEPIIRCCRLKNCNAVIMRAMASQITSLTIVYSSIYSGTDRRKHRNSASLPFVGGIHWWPVNSPHKGTVTWKMIPFDDAIMKFIKCQHRADIIWTCSRNVNLQKCAYRDVIENYERNLTFTNSDTKYLVANWYWYTFQRQLNKINTTFLW